MNEEQIEELMSYVRQTADFATTEMPILAEEILLFSVVKSVATIILLLVFAIPVFRMRKVIAQEDKVGAFLVGLCAAWLGSISILPLMDIAKVITAPRLVILEALGKLA
jgi:hypothetical protein